MELDRQLHSAQRRLIAVSVVLAAVATAPANSDSFQLPKLTSLAIGVSAVVALGLVRVVARAQIEVVRSPTMIAAAVFAGSVAVAAFTAPHSWLAWAGSYGRWTGAGPYLLYVVLLIATASSIDKRGVHLIARALIVAAGVVSLYGIFQWLGLDPWQWEGRFGDAVGSTLANPNFVAGYLGSLSPLVLWHLLFARTLSARLAVAAVGICVLVTIWQTGTVQGPVTLGIGLSVLLGAWLLTQPSRVRRIGLGALIGVPAVVIGIVVAGGLLPRLMEAGNLELRGFYWSAAWEMFRENPLLGVGMDHYEAFYRRYTPQDATLRLGAQTVADQPHSVPLGMLTSGGLLLGFAYLGVVLTTAWSLLQGWRRNERHDERLFVGALAGSWLAYQAQSLVSIDVPPLASLHWLLVGLITVYARPATLTWGMPWPAARKGRKGAALRRLAWSAGVLAFVSLLGISLWVFRADRLVGDTRRAVTAEEVAENFEQATDLVPWEGTYRFLEGGWYAEQGELEMALEAFEEGSRQAPWNLEPVVSAGRSATALGQHERAMRWYEHALEIEPTDPDLKVEAAGVARDAGQAERSVELLETALEIDPEHAEARALLDGS